MANQPIAALRDNFEDNLIGSAWSPLITGSATVTEAAGRATITLPSSTAGTHDGEYVSAGTYDLTGGEFVINIQTMVSTSVAATAQFLLKLDATNYLLWTQVSGNISAHKVVAGVDTSLFTAAWSATTYKYLKISESGGTLTFWSSTNGTSWTSRATTANPFAVVALTVQFGAYCGNVASPGTFKLEDVNVLLPALTTNWHWTQVEWPLFNRYRNITIAATSGQGYIAVASSVDASGNLVSPQYWSGPLGGDAETLTSQATQAAAQAMAVNLPLDGRWGLPQMVEARYIRLYHRSITGSAYTIREFYPRRIVQADDVEAEVFRGLRFEGHQFVCDYLSALSADVGMLTAGVIDGVTIYAGGVTHPVQLDVNGVRLFTPDSGSAPAAASHDARFYRSAVPTDLIGRIMAWYNTTTSRRVLRLAAEDVNIAGILTAENDVTFQQPLTAYSVNIGSASGAPIGGLRASASLQTDGGINIGTGSGAVAGQIVSSGVSALAGAPISTNIALGVKGPGATTATRGLRVTNSAAAISLDVYDDGSIATRTGNRWNLGSVVTAADAPSTGYVNVIIDGVAVRLSKR